MNKIIFLDIDGTIRDFDGYIPDSTVDSIRRARANGHIVCICTGRPYFQIEKQIINIGFDGIVSGFGSYVVYAGKCVSHICFPAMVFIAFSNYLVENNCIFETQYFDKSYILKQHVEAFREIGVKVQNGLGKKAKQFGNVGICRCRSRYGEWPGIGKTKSRLRYRLPSGKRYPARVC